MDFLDRTLNDASRLTYAWFEAMHTRMDVVVWDTVLSWTDLHSACESMRVETLRLEDMASCFLEDSELSALNASPAGQPFVLTDEMFDIISRCLGHNERTGGLFDVAVSAETAGISLDRKLCLNENDRTATRLDERVRLNLSGFIKGYALDRAMAILRESGVANALVSFGTSSVSAMGNHPGGSGWPVATAEGRRFVLKDECLTTSGNSRDDRRHIMNPLTGRYVEGKSMVSVCTQTAEEGEVLSTTSFLRMNTNN